MLPKDHARQPTPEAIRAGLGRITASPGFANAERMRRFIGYIVNKTIEGEAETLKEYPIGVEVFDRVDFDPRTDTIVRVEARRLRKKLQEYYVAEGLVDPVVISLPSGSYVPLFNIREETAEPVSMPARRSGWVFNRWVLVATNRCRSFAPPSDLPLTRLFEGLFIDLRFSLLRRRDPWPCHCPITFSPLL